MKQFRSTFPSEFLNLISFREKRKKEFVYILNRIDETKLKQGDHLHAGI